MREFVSFNSRILKPADGRIPTVSSAALYGKGIFTSIAIYEGKPFLWEKHWRRLSDNAAKLNIDLSEFSEEKTRQALDEIIDNNGVKNGRARITFFDESSSGTWQVETERKTSLLIMTADFRLVSEDFRLTVSQYRVNSISPLAGTKSCNYLDNILAFEEANRSGFDEAIRLNERGEVASACMANVFWLKEDKLYTPSLKTGGLPGTTRELILENLECEEVEDTDAKIHMADAIFLTSAGLGIVPVAELEEKKLSAADHPILHLIPRAKAPQ